MGQGNFAGAGHAAAPDQGRAGGSVVRGAKRPHLPAIDSEAADQRLHGRRFQRFVVRHQRQQSGETGCQHGLAGARRANQQHGMAAGGGNFHRALGEDLALDVRKVGDGRRQGQGLGHVARQGKAGVGAGAEVGAHLQQGCGWIDGGIGNQRRLVGVGLRQDEAAAVAAGGALHGVGHGQSSAYRAQLAGQRELAGKFEPVQPRARNLARGGQDADGDRQIEAARLLGQVGRREVDGDAMMRQFETGVGDGGAHAVTRFLHLGVGQAHDRNGRIKSPIKPKSLP
jgi:hypothetical protein